MDHEAQLTKLTDSDYSIHEFSVEQLRNGPPAEDRACPPALHALSWERHRLFEESLANRAGWKHVCDHRTQSGCVGIRVSSRARHDTTSADEFLTQASFKGIRASQLIQQFTEFRQRSQWDMGLVHQAYLKRYSKAEDGMLTEIVCYCSTAGLAGLIASRSLVDLRTRVDRTFGTDGAAEIISSVAWAPGDDFCQGWEPVAEWRALADLDGLVRGCNRVGCGTRLRERFVDGEWVVDTCLLYTSDAADDM
eukprot:446758-Prymnesium_polylepis.1